MGFFGKKKEIEIKENDESILKEELETEVEQLQNEFRTKQTEITKISEKIQTVKEEYDTTVSNLMLVKKEFNQKKMELDTVQREYREIREKIKNAQQIKDTKSINDFNKTEKEFKQQIEVGKELDEANSRLYNAKEELDKKDQFQDTSILTPKEKKEIKGNTLNEKANAGVIEAASVVVGSLKSKLNITQKELEQIQGLLEEEREAHKKTRQELMNIKSNTNES